MNITVKTQNDISIDVEVDSESTTVRDFKAKVVFNGSCLVINTLTRVFGKQTWTFLKILATGHFLGKLISVHFNNKLSQGTFCVTRTHVLICKTGFYFNLAGVPYWKNQ